MDSSSDLPQPIEVSSPSTPRLPEPTPYGGVFERLLDRYITVWIWSVLFGASTGLVFTLISYRTDSRWGLLNALLMFILLVSLFAALTTWRALMKCMSVYLIPKFILHKFREPVTSVPTKEAESQPSLAKKESEAESKPVITSTTTQETESQVSLAQKESEAESKAADALRRAFEYLVIGAAARILMTVLEMIYASLRPF